jgi:hypothetical protein
MVYANIGSGAVLGKITGVAGPALVRKLKS